VGATEVVVGYIEELDQWERHVVWEYASKLVVAEVELLQPLELEQRRGDGTTEVVVGEVEPLELVQLRERERQLAPQPPAMEVQPDDLPAAIARDTEPCTAAGRVGGAVWERPASDAPVEAFVEALQGFKITRVAGAGALVQGVDWRQEEQQYQDRQAQGETAWPCGGALHQEMLHRSKDAAQ